MENKPSAGYDFHSTLLGRGLSPQRLHRIYAYQHAVPKSLPLPLSGGQVVILFSFRDDRFAVIPAAHFGRDGKQRPISANGLRTSSRADLPFLYEIPPLRALRCQGDMLELAQEWVKRLDQPDRERF